MSAAGWYQDWHEAVKIIVEIPRAMHKVLNSIDTDPAAQEMILELESQASNHPVTALQSTGQRYLEFHLCWHVVIH